MYTTTYPSACLRFKNSAPPRLPMSKDITAYENNSLSSALTNERGYNSTYTVIVVLAPPV